MVYFHLPNPVMNRLTCLAFAMSATLACAGAAAQSFPSKPIRIVVPFAAGGPSDITARNISPRMTELLGVSIVVDNRGGANGFIGSEIVAKRPRTAEQVPRASRVDVTR